MTVIGKMLVFLVFVLALVWNALVVNAYVTRTNWKAQADGYRAEALKAAEAANSLRKLIDAEREAAEDKARVVAEDRNRQYEQLAAARKSYDEISKAYQERQKADRDQGAQSNELQANLKTAQKQVEEQVARMNEMEKKINDLTQAAEKARVEMVKAQIEAQQQAKRAEQLKEGFQRLQEEKADLLSPRRDGTVGRTVPVPANFRGTVRDRSGEFVSFTPGLDVGLQVGAVLDVSRTTGGGRYLGKLKVTHLDPKEGVGQFIPKPGATAADFPQRGDQLLPD